MSKALIVASRDIRVELKSKRFWFSTLILPLFMLVFTVTGLMFSNKTSSVTIFAKLSAFLKKLRVDKSQKIIGVVDEAGILLFPVQGNVGEELPLSGDPALPPLQPLSNNYKAFPDSAAAKAALERKELKGYVEVNSDYLTRPALRMTWYSPEQEDKELPRLEKMLRQRLVEAWNNPEIGPSLLQPLGQSEVNYLHPGEAKKANQPARNLSQLVLPAFFAGSIFFLVIFTMDRLTRGLLEERKNRLMEVLLSTMDARDLMLGKLLGTGALSLLQVAILTLCTGVPIVLLVTGLFVGFGKLLVALLFVFLVYALFAILVLGLGVFGGTQQEVMQWVMPLFFPMLLVFYTFPFLNQLSELSWFPITVLFPLLGSTMSVMLYSADLLNPIWLIASLVAQTIYVLLAFRISVRLFRFGLLTTGQSMSIPFLMRAWRQSKSQ